MIVYYDVLRIDDESLLGTRHAERFRRLEALVACRPGYAELVQREVVDFGGSKAAAQLRQAFAKCITARLEGLVIKPDDDPYFDFDFAAAGHSSGALRSCCIKLKKEYIGTFGEVGDFAVVGGRYDAAKATEYPPDSLPGRVRWTHFFIGCLDRAKSTPTRPHFVVTNVVTLSVAQMATFTRHCRPRVVPCEPTQNKNKRKSKSKKSTERMDLAEAPFDVARIEPGIDGCKGGPTELFADPPVVDIRCFSFHRQGYGRFWSPRFPCVVKFHFDRTFRDALTFEALQAMAEEESARRADGDVPYDEENEKNKKNEKNEDENAHWVDQLKKADRRGIAVDAETSQSSGPATATTARSQSSASASQFSPLSLPNTHAHLLDDINTQYDTHELYEIHETEEVEEMDETDGDERGREAVRESSQVSELSIATVNSPEVRRAQLSTSIVIDLTGEDEEGGEGGDKQENKKEEEEEETWQSVTDEEYDSDESQQGIARLFALEEARLSQPSLPPPVISTSPPSTPPRSSPVADVLSSSPVEPASSMIASQAESQPESQAESQPDSSQRPIQKRLRTWDGASMYPAISPPALKRARSGV